MVALQAQPILLGHGDHPLKAHIVFEVGQFYGAGYGIRLDLGDVFFVAVAGVVGETRHCFDDFLGESGVAQILERDLGILDYVVQDGGGHRRLAMLLEHETKRMQDIRRSGLIALSAMRIHRQHNGLFEIRHGIAPIRQFSHIPAARYYEHMILRSLAILLAGAAWACAATVSGSPVTLVRVPGDGIQPQAVMDGEGVLHLIYFRGEASAGDIYYVRSRDGGATFSRPLRVNSQSGSAIAVGNIRGAHLALGRNGRIHVAWNGSMTAEPKGPGGQSPMLYARLNDNGSAFEAQRNVIQSAYGLDGGGTLAADSEGRVYVFWHAPAPGTKGEDARRVWVAASLDDGRTFASERPASGEATGACGCCGMAAFADSKGNLYALYRSARETVHRDIYLLFSPDHGRSFTSADIHPWNIGACVMSEESFAEGPYGVVAAWETERQVYFARVDRATGRIGPLEAAPGEAKGRKFPALAVNARGETLLAWTEGMGWKKSGSVAWQIFDRNGRPLGDRGEAPGVPVWSLVTAVARPDGGFDVIY